MLKAVVVAAALLIASSAAIVHADNQPAARAETRLKTNAEFLKAASLIIQESGSEEAKALLKLAEASSEEARAHLATGDHAFALEDLGDSTQTAIYAIIIAKNSKNGSVRDMVITEEMALLERREHQRKENLIRKGMDEVEAFIKTAERLLNEGPAVDQAVARLDETKALYAASKEKVSRGEYDGALEDVNRSYRLATAVVKDIKRSRNDIITFPKAGLTDERDLLAYELKRNDTYMYFADTVVTKDGEAGKILTAAKRTKGEAQRAIEAGKGTEAMERLKASTELFIRAIKASGN